MNRYEAPRRNIIVEGWVTYRSVLICSVADPGCLPRILIFIDPGARISDLGTNKGEIFFVVLPSKIKKINN
jgi:hypothetical protein